MSYPGADAMMALGLPPSSDPCSTTYPAFLSAGNGLDQLRKSVAAYGASSLQGRISALAETPSSPEGAQPKDGSFGSPKTETNAPTPFDRRQPVSNQTTVEQSSTDRFDWRHEAVARALAQADGHDPDLKVVDVKSAKEGPFGSVAAGFVQPAWHCYLQMSAGIVAALASAK